MPEYRTSDPDYEESLDPKIENEIRAWVKKKLPHIRQAQEFHNPVWVTANTIQHALIISRHITKNMNISALEKARFSTCVLEDITTSAREKREYQPDSNANNVRVKVSRNSEPGLLYAIREVNMMITSDVIWQQEKQLPDYLEQACEIVRRVIDQKKPYYEPGEPGPAKSNKRPGLSSTEAFS